MTARISVILPVYNGAAYLREALESAFAQTLPPHEIIVVDDGSTDATPEIASSFDVVYVRQDNAGVSSARNRAIHRAGGDYLAFLDADDVWLPEKLERQIAQLDGHEDAYATCGVRYQLEPGASLHGNAAPEAAAGYFTPSCWLLPRSVVERVGPFRTELRVAEDIDWLVRARELGVQTLAVEEPLVIKRVHEGSLSYASPGGPRVWLDALRQTLPKGATPAGY
jgi:glycosyltransferase involved in cell wall biosynthesis